VTAAPLACPTGYACITCRAPAPAPACEGFSDACGAAAGEPGCPSLAAGPNVLTVSIAETGAGPTSITRCAACTAEGRYTRLRTDAAMRLVVEHQEHVRETTP
jgi:hypothetical protein